jgi:hypothetical protein
MAAVRLYPRHEWEARLRHDYGCKPINESDEPAPPKMKSGEWWVTAHQFVFSVPADYKGNLRSDDLQQVVVQIAKLRPIV